MFQDRKGKLSFASESLYFYFYRIIYFLRSFHSRSPINKIPKMCLLHLFSFIFSFLDSPKMEVVMVANENKNAGTRGGTVNRCLSLAEAAATTFKRQQLFFHPVPSSIVALPFQFWFFSFIFSLD